MNGFYDILIVGYGNIGKHMHNELKGAGDIDIYDPYIPEYNMSSINNYNIAFICCPTEMLPDGSCDISAVENAVENTKASVLVIKSTVPVGTCDMLKQKYNKTIVFSPEYYGTTIHAPESPDFVILAGNPAACDKVSRYYYKVKKRTFRTIYTDYKTAELAKYMENCFLALKVTFCAEFATIAESMGISYPALRSLFVQDERMGDSHTFIVPEQKYYDSHCLNKDIPGLIQQTDKAHLMEAMLEINKQKRVNNEF